MPDPEVHPQVEGYWGHVNPIGSSSEFVYETLPNDDPTQRQSDIALAREKIEWEPSIELASGLEKTINYFGELLESNKTCRV